MGINKIQKHFTTQMKFTTLFALVAGASAIKITSHSHAHIKAHAHPSHKSMLAVAQLAQLEAKAKAEPAIEWAKAELKRDGDITLQEIHDALVEHGIELTEDEWEAVEEGFGWVDANDDDKIDVDEAKAAAAAFEAECGEW